MVKNTILALVAAATLAGATVPAFAGDDTGYSTSTSVPTITDDETSQGIETAFGSGSPGMRAFVADTVLAELNQRGIRATTVEDWSGLVRAFVTLDDGSQEMQFFRPGSLERVQL